MAQKRSRREQAHESEFCVRAPPAPTSTPIATNTHSNPPATSITASSSQNAKKLSPRALEKRPARDIDASASPQPQPQSRGAGLPLRTPSPAHLRVDTDALEEQTLPRRSFLDAFLSRSPQRATTRDVRPATSHVLNPINYVPRPNPVQVSRPGLSTNTQTIEVGSRETRTLLTLPEQRRSRQNSPSSPVVDHSPVVTDPGSHRSSIGLPGNRSSRNLELSKSNAMSDSEKPLAPAQGTGKPQQQIPVSKYNMSERDVEANLPASQSILGQSYGLAKEDQPADPPRRVSSVRSLRHHKSTVSLRSAQYSYRGQGDFPPPSLDGTNNPDHDEGSMSEELAWGPAHPCFPHMNSHVPLNSAEYAETRVIRIKRDWMVKGDLAPAYSNLYPEILDPLLPELEFRHIVQHINKTLVEACDPFSTANWMDSLLGLATGWLWEDFRPSGIKGKLRGLELWIAQWNRNVGARDGIIIVPLRRTGYMSLDIQIPDPQVRVVGENDTWTTRPPSLRPPTTTDGKY